MKILLLLLLTSPDTLRIAFVLPPDTAAAAHALRGATLGAEEGMRTGALVGLHVDFARVSPADAGETRASALVGGFAEEDCRALAAVAERTRTLFLSVGCEDTSPRADQCGAMTFHLAPPRGLADAGFTAWHGALVRYGAAQLNDRYRGRFGAEMDGAAWTGWFAVKLALEAALRARTVEPEGMRSFLESSRAQFDGHKGRALRFDVRTRRLWQPAYRASAGSVEEVVPPVPSASVCGE